MLTCQYVLWKRENTEVRVIRKRVCVWAHKLSLSGPYDLKQKQIQFWLDESAATCRILPPRVIQTLVYGRACTCGCVSHDVHGVHQTLHHYCCVSQRSHWTVGSVSTPLFARFVLTCHDDQQKKTRRRKQASMRGRPNDLQPKSNLDKKTHKE